MLNMTNDFTKKLMGGMPAQGVSSQHPSLSPFPPTLAEVTVMEVERLRALCIEQEELAGTWEMARQKDKFRVRLLSGDNERRKESSLLIEKMYSWRGYDAAGDLDAMPNRITLNAELNGHIYGTLTVNVDSAAGLAVDEVYRDKVSELRAQGRKVCEFGKFAVEQAVKSKRLLATLFHLMYIYAGRINGCTDALIEVNPRHVAFYQRYLDFKVWGSERMCHRVGAPAVLMRLDFEWVKAKAEEMGGRWRELPEEKSLYKYFFPKREEDQIVARLRVPTNAV